LLGNLGYTSTIANDVFQGHFRDFGSDVARFTVNTTIGVGGILDPATRLGLEKHARDFGQTLGKLGLPTGSYLVLPLLGPSDVRDAFGKIPDRLTSLDGQIFDGAASPELGALRGVDGRVNTLPLDKALDSAYDPYALARSVFFQKRDYKVHEDDPNFEPANPEVREHEDDRTGRRDPLLRSGGVPLAEGKATTVAGDD